MLDHGTQRRIELFLFEEARLLDAGQFEEWLKLYEPLGIYWMPSRPMFSGGNNLSRRF